MDDIIKVLASGSSGNCYLVKGKERLLLEAGIPIAKIKQGLGFQLSSVAACLITHSHADHSKATKDLMKAGIDVYMGMETAQELGLKGEHRLHIVKPKKTFRVGPWAVLGFPAVHDAPTLGYLIAGEGIKVCYLTDSAYSPYRFKNVSHYLIEINFDKQTLKENLRRGTVDSDMYRRLLRTHMGLETALDFFKGNDLSKLQAIHVLHVSDRNANEERVKKAIQGATGVPVYIY